MTPSVPNGGRKMSQADVEAKGATEGGKRQVDLGSQAEFWQTPAVDSFRSRGGDRKDEMGLDQQARFWPTPTAKDEASSGSAAYSTESGRHSGTTLTDATRNWPYPSARDHRDPNAHPYQDRDGGAKGELLREC